MEEKTPISGHNADESGWRRRFKGRVESLQHLDDHIVVTVQLYSLPRPPDSEFSNPPAASDEQVLFLSTVDPSVRLLLRVVASRASVAATAVTVTVEVRSNRLPTLHDPGHLEIQLSASDQPFTVHTPTAFGYAFAAVPTAALGSLRVELTIKTGLYNAPLPSGRAEDGSVGHQQPLSSQSLITFLRTATPRRSIGIGSSPGSGAPRFWRVSLTTP